MKKSNPREMGPRLEALYAVAAQGMKPKSKVVRKRMWGVFEFDEGKTSLLRVCPTEEGACDAADDLYWAVINIRPVIVEYREVKK
jgi:hypothetical protein